MITTIIIIIISIFILAVIFGQTKIVLPSHWPKKGYAWLKGKPWKILLAALGVFLILLGFAYGASHLFALGGGAFFPFFQGWIKDERERRQLNEQEKKVIKEVKDNYEKTEARIKAIEKKAMEIKRQRTLTENDPEALKKEILTSAERAKNE